MLEASGHRDDSRYTEAVPRWILAAVVGVVVEENEISGVGGGVVTGDIGGGALATTGLRPAQPVTKIINAKNANKTSHGNIAAFREPLTIGPGSCRRFFLVRRSSSGTPCLQPSRRLGQFLRNFPKKCRGALFRFRRKIVLDELPQPSQFRIQLLAYLFELVHDVFPQFSAQRLSVH